MHSSEMILNDINKSPKCVLLIHAHIHLATHGVEFRLRRLVHVFVRAAIGDWSTVQHLFVLWDKGSVKVDLLGHQIQEVCRLYMYSRYNISLRRSSGRSLRL